MIPAGEALTRFAADLDALVTPGQHLGVAVSGGSDSLALLLLAAAARPGLISAASVDHALRPGSRAETEAVATLCDTLQVPHRVLTIDWRVSPTSAVQEQARNARYAALGDWAGDLGLSNLVTGHHADDQAETLMMRLVRGAGVRGLAGMRPSTAVPGRAGVTLVRPLLGWRRAALEAVVANAGIAAADDPSNHDERHERVRIRAAMTGSAWLDSAMLARSAAHLAAADEAIEWAVDQTWATVCEDGDGFSLAPGAAPPEIRRRLVMRCIDVLAHEGDGAALRGREVDHLLESIEQGGTATLRGVRASGGTEWRFIRSPPRR